jgi:predicted small secreted protein
MRVTSAILISITVLALAACNTVKGAGKDIVSVGQAGQDAMKK